MIYFAIILGCIIGGIIGLASPVISYTYSSYLSIAIIAALDTVFGGLASIAKKNFDLKIFLSGFFGNSILSIALTYLGNKLNVDIYLAAIVVFVGRMFTNLAILRRYYIDKWIDKIEKKKNGKKVVAEDKTEEIEIIDNAEV
jgi:small basic protein